jgi:hypothetical protein
VAPTDPFLKQIPKKIDEHGRHRTIVIKFRKSSLISPPFIGHRAQPSCHGQNKFGNETAIIALFPEDAIRCPSVSPRNRPAYKCGTIKIVELQI